MRRTIFAGGLIVDGTGSEPAPADVVIADGTIVDVGVGLDGDEIVDCTGRVVLPGLFDCHVHLLVNGLDPEQWRHRPFSLGFFEAVHAMRATLSAGVTTVREAGGADLGVREAQRRGLVTGPRMQISITLLSQTGGHGDPWEPSGATSPIFPVHPGRPSGVVDGPEEIRQKVRELIRAGADVIKVATSGDAEHWLVISTGSCLGSAYRVTNPVGPGPRRPDRDRRPGHHDRLTGPGPVRAKPLQPRAQLTPNKPELLRLTVVQKKLL
jgi:imidazolonepropionase-like amidohydrolase